MQTVNVKLRIKVHQWAGLKLKSSPKCVINPHRISIGTQWIRTRMSGAEKGQWPYLMAMVTLAVQVGICCCHLWSSQFHLIYPSLETPVWGYIVDQLLELVPCELLAILPPSLESLPISKLTL